MMRKIRSTHGCFIKHQDVARRQQRTRQRNELALALTQIRSAFVDLSVKSSGHARHVIP
jgi:hypothetical protein